MSPRPVDPHAIDWEQRVEMRHGGGGKAMSLLVEQLFVKAFDNPLLSRANDQAVFASSAGRLAMSTDSFVISPLFFPGGNIGSLAVHGTVNDLAMSGGTPLYLSAGFIIEEGFPLGQLRTIVQSMAAAASEAGVTIVTGDTKVVEKGKADGLFINTAGVAQLAENVDISGDRARPGDAILINGAIGDHGMAVMCEREHLDFKTPILSDSASLNGLVSRMISAVPDIHCLRDPTRGGVAATLNELAQQSAVGMVLQESALPLKPAVSAACELLGLDPLHVANEGKLLAICAKQDAERLLQAMQQHPLGRDAAIIGTVCDDSNYFVRMETRFGGMRMVDWISGEQLPRIC